MPEVTYTTTLALPLEQIWDFIQDMNNWAPFLTGYQKHEIIDDRNSIWTLKGDVGILSRTVRLEVHITEWSGPNRVSFTLKGLNEVVEGDGTFSMRTLQADAGLSAPSTTAVTRQGQNVEKGWLGSLLERLFRFFFRRMHGTIERPPPPAANPKEIADRAELSFRLRMDAGGPTGPLVNAMLEPALLPAAEDLGNRIAAHLEAS